MSAVHARRERKQTAVASIAAWLIMLVIAFPIYWMIISSLRPESDLVQGVFTFFPRVLTFDNYLALGRLDFPLWFANTLFVSVTTTLIVITVAVFGAYGLTRFMLPGRSAISAGILVAYLFPQVLMLVPLFLVITNLRLHDTHFALILASVTFSLPLSLWLVQSHMRALPVDSEEAAMVDGVTRVGALFRIALPQIWPGVVSTAMIVLVLVWNNYIFALVFVSSANLKTLPLGIATYADALNTQWGPLMASCVVTSVPIVLLLGLVQKRFIVATSSGGLKG